MKPLRKLLIAVLALAGLVLSAEAKSAEVYAGGYQLHGHWAYSPWYGWFDARDYPYIFHIDHGWQVIVRADKDSMLVYDYARVAYIWTHKDLYPWVYQFGTEPGWLERKVPRQRMDP